MQGQLQRGNLSVMTSVEGVDLASTVLALRRIGDDKRLL
jgi:hypothetical protein